MIKKSGVGGGTDHISQNLSACLVASILFAENKMVSTDSMRVSDWDHLVRALSNNTGLCKYVHTGSHDNAPWGLYGVHCGFVVTGVYQ